MTRGFGGAIVVLVLAGAGGCDLHSRPARDEIRFEHGVHIGRGQSCTDCHNAATLTHEELAAEGGAERTRPLLPSEATCRACHSEGEQARCGYCHTAPRDPQPYVSTESDIHFDHSIHDDAQNGLCVRCHGPPGAGSGMTLSGFAPVSPPMNRCTDDCHADDFQHVRCTVCHTNLHQYDVQSVASMGHGPGWATRHSRVAGVDRQLCGACHEPTFCEDCHLNAQGAPLEAYAPLSAERDFVHRGDFISRHGIEAGLERGTCARCHGIQFCDGCHQASGVGGSVAPGSPHPPGWLDPFSAFGHAAEARRNLLGCAACHEADAEQTCVPCHRVGGVTASPHPPGFGMAMDSSRHAVCRVCHVP